jgi:hypothetical protein
MFRARVEQQTGAISKGLEDIDKVAENLGGMISSFDTVKKMIDKAIFDDSHKLRLDVTDDPGRKDNLHILAQIVKTV